MKQMTPLRKRRYRDSKTYQKPKKTYVGNPEGGKELFWVLYIGFFVLMILKGLGHF